MRIILTHFQFDKVNSPASRVNRFNLDFRLTKWI